MADVSLLRRLYPFSKPYRLLIGLSILLVMLITLLDLSMPYITKVAIDRYIVPSLTNADPSIQETAGTGYRLLEVDLENPDVREVVRKFPQLFTENNTNYKTRNKTPTIVGTTSNSDTIYGGF